MCFFITIAVPARSVGAVRAVHAGAGMAIEPTANPSAVAAAGAGRVPLLVTGGGCSCAWYTPPAALDADEKAARARARYERLGWSAAKIERALASAARPPRAGDGLHEVVVELLQAIALAHGSVAAWVHDVHGAVETESYELSRTVAWTSEELARNASSFPLDVRIEITATTAGRAHADDKSH
jgi:hypothetical protein